VVQEADVARVGCLLGLHGASISNHRCQLRTPSSFGFLCDKIWDADGGPWPDCSPHQPVTPLRLAVFRISDCCLTPLQSAAYGGIVQLLVSHGADAVDALRFFAHRYGQPDSSGGGGGGQDCDRSSIFQDVWRILSAAAQSSSVPAT